MANEVPGPTPPDPSPLEQRLERERIARELAEAQLELKARELRQLSQKLEETSAELELRVQQRTAELKAAAEHASQASRAKSDFLANMSHEIRASLNGVLGLLQIAMAESVAPEARGQLGLARDCAEALLSLLNDILDLSKIEAGRLVLEHAPFHLGEILESVETIFAPRARAQGITLDFRRAADVPEWFVGDPIRLRQLMVNLIANAVKFTHAGGVVVEITRLPERRRGREDWMRLRVAVTDTGIGIAPEQIDALFKEYVQAEAGTARQYGGTGLGLSICRRLVELMSGRVGVESTPGRGSQFWFEVPFGVAGAPVEQVDEPHPGSTWRAAAGQRVLVVDDQPVNRLVARKLVERLGLEAVDVASGHAALALLAKERFAAVLMDCQMPDLDGLDTTAAIRDVRTSVLQHDVPVVALTANVMQGDRERCLAAGMNGYLSKPVMQEDLAVSLSHFVVAELPPPTGASA